MNITNLWRHIPFVIAIAIALIGGCTAHAQLVINEVCSKNNTVLDNGSGGHPDWIEVYNAGSGMIELDTYFMSDNIDDPGPWRLPDRDLAPGEYAVFLSGDPSANENWFPFSLSRDGERLHLLDANGAVLSYVDVPYLHTDDSYGTWGASELRYYDQPTPGSANTTEAFLGYTTDPLFNRPAGILGNGAEVTLSTEIGATMHFTSDGADPTYASSLYTGPLYPAGTQVIKAIATKPEYLPSQISTSTFLVNEHTDLAIVSISVHNDSLFDDSLGLYELGPNAELDYPHYGANFWSERDIAVRVEYFDELHQRGLDQVVDLKIHGGRVSRNQPQRPLRFTARKQYGASVMEYPFFPEKGWLNKFKTLVLRNSGADWCVAQQRDQIWHQISQHAGLNVDVLAYRPVAVYINGEYWGLMELRERIDDDHLRYNYGADKDDVIIMEEENVAIQGDTIHFHELKEYIYGNDMNDPVHYAHVDSVFDIASFIDYFALEMYAGNADWPSNNLKYWKPSVTEGKWRYLMYDLDATMNLFGWIPLDFDMFYWVLVHRTGFVHSEIFRSMLANTEFKRNFLNRLADMMNTSLSEGQVRHEISMLRNGMASEIPHHFTRWNCDPAIYEEHALNIIPEFARVRCDVMREDVLQTFELPNTAELVVDVFPPNSGQVKLNSLNPELPFKGIYFNGNAIDLNAMPMNGSVFDHWEYSEEPEQHIMDPIIQRSFASSGKITAYFGNSGEPLQIFPNPSNGPVSISLRAEEEGLCMIRVMDLQGNLLKSITQYCASGVNAIISDLGDLSAGVYVVALELNNSVHTERLVRSVPH